MKPTLHRTARRLPLVTAAGLAVLLATAGCGTAASPTGAASDTVGPIVGTPSTSSTPSTPAAPAPPTTAMPPPSTAPTPRPTTPSTPSLHFATPQGAMRYLTAAYNRGDLLALKKVTNSPARDALTAMRQEATNLVLTGCSRRASGDYVCQFRHDYPARLHRSGHGRATFLAAPAEKPGWYMTVLIDCG
jgi:hypothetical protein